MSVMSLSKKLKSSNRDVKNEVQFTLHIIMKIKEIKFQAFNIKLQLNGGAAAAVFVLL